MAVQLMFCRSQFLGFVQNCTQHYFLDPISRAIVKFQVVQLYFSTDTATDWKNPSKYSL